MKNTKQIKEHILLVQNEIKEMKKNLNNSKNYLNYLKGCLKEIKEEEKKGA